MPNNLNILVRPWKFDCTFFVHRGEVFKHLRLGVHTVNDNI